MNRRFRALALGGALLLVPPANLAFATSPIRFEPRPFGINLSGDFREAKADRMSAVDALEDVRSEALKALRTLPIVNSTRYAGKQVPI